MLIQQTKQNKWWEGGSGFIRCRLDYYLMLTITDTTWEGTYNHPGLKESISTAYERGRVIDFDNKKRTALSAIADSIKASDITSTVLKKNLAQFRDEINSFKTKNKINYSLSMSNTTASKPVSQMTTREGRKAAVNARDKMRSVEGPDRLCKARVSLSRKQKRTDEELIEQKICEKGLTREQAIRDIYETAVKTNKKVNQLLGGRIMFEYMICNVPDKDVFRKQCAALQRVLPEMTLESELHDVDDSEIKIFSYKGSCIEVWNDYYIGGVFVKSEIELTQFFKG